MNSLDDSLAGPPGSEQPDKGKLLLLEAARSGNVANVRRILAKEVVEANERDERLFTPLLWGAANGHTKVVEALVKAPKEKNVNISARNDVGDTALHWACWKGDVTSVWLLLQAGADPTVQGENGMLPLHYAATGEHEVVVRALLEWGGMDLHLPNDFGNMAHMLTTNSKISGIILKAANETHCCVTGVELNHKTPHHMCHYCEKQATSAASSMRYPDEDKDVVEGIRVCRNCVERHAEETKLRKQQEEERAALARMNESSTFTVGIAEALSNLPSDEILQDLLMSRASETGAPIADFTIPATTRQLLPPRPPGMWSTVKIMVVSTYEDMISEREYLATVVFPALRHFLRMRRVHLHAVDLFVGASSDAVSDRQSLELHLENSENSRPFIVSLLGERYGHIPQVYEVPPLEKYEWVSEIEPQSRSVPEMAIKYAYLDQPNQALGFFYFRDPKFTNSAKFKALPDDLRESFECESENSRLKLRSLKEELQASVPSMQIFNNYPAEFERVDEHGHAVLVGLEEFGRRLFTDLWTALDVAYPMKESGEKFVVLRNYHQQFIQRNCRNFYGRTKYLHAMVEYASQGEVPDGEGTAMLIVGEHGTGKTAIMGEFVRQFTMENPGVFMFYHFVGAAPESSDARGLILRLCQEMVTHFQLSTPTTLLEKQDFEALRRSFGKILTEASSKGLIVMLLDGMHALEYTPPQQTTIGGEVVSGFDPETFDWLPETLPQRVRIIISTIPNGTKAEWLQNRYNKSQISIGPLEDGEAREILRTHVLEYGHELDRDQTSLIIRKNDSNRPIFLTGVAEEIRQFVNTDQITKLCKDFPGSVDALFLFVLDRLEKDFGKKVVETALGSILCSPNGLPEPDLLSITGYAANEDGTPLPYWTWAKIKHILNAQVLGEAGDHGFSFLHRQFADCVELRYVGTADARVAVHKSLAAHYRRAVDPKGDRTWMSTYTIGLHRLPYHLKEAEMWTELVTDLCDVSYIERRVIIDGAAGTIQWYKSVLCTPTFAEEAYVRILQRFAAEWQGQLSRSPEFQRPQLRQCMDILCSVIEEHAQEAVFSLILARNAVSDLSEAEIGELSMQKKPHGSVIHIMEMVLLCKGSKSTTWKSAKSQLQNPGFISDLLAVNVENLKDKAANKAIKLLEYHAYSQWEIKLKSSAAAAFLQWVTAILHHYKKLMAKLEQDRLNQATYQVSEEDRQAALAVVDQAVNQLKTVNKGALTELKSQTNPPDVLKVVMNCVLILFNVERPSWAEAVQRLSDVNFLATLLNFDRDGVKRDTLNKLEAVLKLSPDLTSEVLTPLSTAAAAICEWTKAMQQ
eukprot:TRINITY_DN284_c0_g1_i2.p1 TRINITY_DN284_c0_g1~~TRINITY_DN284_c0_g1_i2.p1  ORF type:complete len:1318 (-),score=228.14 TRINITY_DN284_c0_g1_i2:344-4297(-)